MVDNRSGRRFAVPASRRLTWDLLYFHRGVPLCSHDRRMDLKDLALAREGAGVRISWPALFLKAMASVSLEYPELRQIWYRWPWAHLYQHPGSVGVLTIQREIAGEPWLFWGRIASPELKTLPEIQAMITRYQTEAPSKVFGRDLRLAGLPLLLRRLIWWWNLNVETGSRAKRIGTFFLSTLAGRGVEIQLPPSVQTTCLTYGPLDETGISRVTLAYDHRIMDGARVAEILARLEVVLTTDILIELRGLAKAGERVAA